MSRYRKSPSVIINTALENAQYFYNRLSLDKDFEVICDGDYYKMLKSLINGEAPKLD